VALYPVRVPDLKRGHRRRSSGSTRCRPVREPLLISQGLHIADGDRAVGDRDRHIDQHRARIMPAATLPQAVGDLAQRRRQTDPVNKFGEQHCPGVRHLPVPSQVMPVASCPLYVVPAKCLFVWLSWTVQAHCLPTESRHFARLRGVSDHKIKQLLQQRG